MHHLSKCLVAAALVAATSCSGAQEIQVRVDRRGELVVIDAEVTVNASAAEVWVVFTDYDHMATFLSNLKLSKVIGRHGDSLEVSQAGETKVGFLHFAFSAVRTVEVTPISEIRSHLVSGDFKAFSSTTRFFDQSPYVKVLHHGEYVPKQWLPPLIGPAVIEAETRKQYQQFVAEIERRKRASTAR